MYLGCWSPWLGCIHVNIHLLATSSAPYIHIYNHTHIYMWIIYFIIALLYIFDNSLYVQMKKLRCTIIFESFKVQQTCKWMRIYMCDVIRIFVYIHILIYMWMYVSYAYMHPSRWGNCFSNLMSHIIFIK